MIFKTAKYLGQLQNLIARHLSTQGMNKYPVSNMDRKILVWTGKFKTADEVPPFIGKGVIEHARNKFRIKIANIMIGGTALGCLLMVILGRRGHEQGESVSRMAEEWHATLKNEPTQK